MKLIEYLDRLDELSNTEWKENVFLALFDFANELDQYMRRPSEIRWKRAEARRGWITLAVQKDLPDRDDFTQGEEWRDEFRKNSDLCEAHYNLLKAARQPESIDLMNASPDCSNYSSAKMDFTLRKSTQDRINKLIAESLKLPKDSIRWPDHH